MAAGGAEGSLVVVRKSLTVLRLWMSVRAVGGLQMELADSVGKNEPASNPYRLII